MVRADEIPVIDCVGSTPREIGESHGAQLKDRIPALLDFYYDLFDEQGLKREEVRDWGERLAVTVRKFSTDLADEVEGVAAGAGREPWELFALQGRTELLALAVSRSGQPPAGECTSISCPGMAVAGQNWDWDLRMASGVVILRLPRCGKRPEMLTLTEAGIVGKVGLNEHGLGTCINILFGKEPARTADVVPVHILARAALECESIEDVDALLRGAPRYCYSHLLVTDKRGRYRMMEFCGPKLEVLGEEHDGKEAPPAVVHTNHYLHPSFAGSDENSDLAHTRKRRKRAVEIIEGFGSGAPSHSDVARELAKSVLGDRKDAPKSILYNDAPGMGPDRTLATLCSFVLELKSLQMHVTRGDAMLQQYDVVPLSPSTRQRSPG
mmetsp:Transcript_34655/g.99922  ORF Transcript_34655/g.99922 Transcript_34655/m.99922 type:complete len:382 (+) Transcript_34655:100-1245(+)